MGTIPLNDTTTALVHAGWDYLKSQRPLAAWASWQRGLRIDPESKIALSALAKLESATELPLAARVPYRFREPRDPVRRATWNERIAGENLEDLDAAAGLFERLAALDVFDAAAWYNLALCLAWAGKNADAIECLARVVDLEATAASEDAVTAWMLAEVLRQGGVQRRWPMIFDLHSRSAGSRATPRRCFANSPKSANCPRPAHRVPRGIKSPRLRCLNGSIGRSTQPLRLNQNPTGS